MTEEIQLRKLVKENSRIAFADLAFNEGGSDGMAIVGAPALGRYVELDRDAVEVIRALQRGETVRQVAREMRKRTGEKYDIVDLLEALHKRGFVTAVDGASVVPQAAEAPKKEPLRIYARLDRIPVASLRWMRHPLVPVLLLAPVVLWLALILTGEVARPRYRDLGISDRPSLSLLASFAAILFFANLHELGHFFTARSYGIDVVSRVRHRFYLVVLETDVTNAWVLPTAARLRIFLAGIAINLFFAALFGLLAHAVAWGHLDLDPAWYPVFRLASYANVFPLHFQLLIFARTDLYYVFALMFRSRRLLEDSRTATRTVVVRAWRRLVNRPYRNCPERCGNRCYADEPFCMRCGVALPFAKATRVQFAPERRRTFLRLGVFLAALQAVGVTILGVLLVFYTEYFLNTVTRRFRNAQLSPSGPSFLDYMDVLVPLLVLAVQAGLMLYVVVGPVVRGKAFARVLGRLRARLARAAPPEPIAEPAAETSRR